MTEKVVHTTEGVDSFADATPIELPNRDEPQAGGGKNDSGLETFDDQEVKTLEDVEVKDGKKQEVKRETARLEDQEKDSDDEGTEDEPEEEEGDDTPEEEGEEDSEKDAGAKPRGKTVRLKDGDGESYDLPLDATVPVKVKGKKEFVSIQELRDNYSGKQVWDERLQEADTKIRGLEEREKTFERNLESTKAYFGRIGDMIKEGLEGGENSDPLGAMKYLVDLSGRSVLEFEKKVLDHYGNLAMSFSEMSEAEQKLYWTERENQILKDSQATKARESEERKASEQRTQKIHQTMEQYGISEQDFEATEAHIESLGFDMENVTPEQICHWAALQPLVEQATELTSQFEEDLSTDELEALTQGTADAMFKYPELDPQEALKLSAKRIGYDIFLEDEAVEELKNRHKGGEDQLRDRRKAKVAEKQSESRGYESFDDYDDEQYG